MNSPTFRQILITLCASLWLTGCASIDTVYQDMLIRTQPGGARVYQDDRFLGTTPDYMSVRRGRSPIVQIRYGDRQTKLVQLDTKYRWGSSFGRNLIFVSYAPIGWLMDLATGAAWESNPIDVPQFKPDPTVFTVQRRRLSVAPALAADPDIGLAIGELIQKRLKREKDYELADYLESAKIFQFHGAEKGFPADPSQTAVLMADLKSDFILWSEVKETKGEYEIKGEIKNVYDQTTARAFTWTVTPEDGQLRTDLSRRKYFSEYFQLLPNTVFLNLSGYSPNFEIDKITYTGKELEDASFGDRVARYVSAISVTHEERPRFDVRGQWAFNFTPTLNLSRKRIQFHTYKPLEGAEFDRVYASFGYGIEIGYRWKYGYPYFSLLPSFVWTQLQYDSPTAEGRIYGNQLAAEIEIGYKYFLNEHWILKFYSRSLGEATDSWQTAFRRITDSDLVLGSGTSVYAGIAIGYHIPASLKDRGGWNIKDPKKNLRGRRPAEDDTSSDDESVSR